MYLKSIEIQGFKSFPDNTVISLSRGITAIVGPNGSGKSNIVDAIRWVLGEQSSKNLRGGKMEDVIFGGTARRTPAGYSQVTITIDNGDGMLSVEYDEIGITRRYYRSGESEFYINRKAVRLKDVHELFMDTGLGRDGYSIIGQGKIDEILSVKSGDRREIFEEAAGITKFRYRKEEAERKLGGAEDNLVRIRDIIAELEAQIEPLRIQAEAAQKYLIVRDRLRALEVSLWLESLEKLKENQHKLQVDSDNAVRLLSAKNRELEELYQEIDRQSERMRGRDVEVESERKKLELLQEESGGYRSKIAVCQANIDNIAENLQSLEGQVRQDNNRSQELRTQQEAYQERLREIEVQKADIGVKIQEYTEQSFKAGQKNAQALEVVSGLNAQLLALGQKDSQVKAELAAAQAAIHEQESGQQARRLELEEIEDKIQEVGVEIKSIEERLAAQKEQADSNQNVLDGFGMVAESRRTKLEQAEKLAKELGHMERATADRLEMLKAMEQDMEGFSGAVRTVIAAGKGGQLRGIHGTVAQLVKTQDKYAVALEIALGGALQNIVVDTEQDGKEAIGYLKSRNGGRATFLPISSVRGRDTADVFSKEPGYVGMASTLITYKNEYTEIVKNLVGNVLVVEHIDAAIAISRKHPGRVRIVTVDGQVISQWGAMTGGSLSKSSGILSRSNEIERLSTTAYQLKEKVEAAQATLATAKREWEAAKYQIEVAQGGLLEAQQAMRDLGRQREGNQTLLESYNTRRDKQAQLEQSQEIRLKELEQVVQGCNAQIEKVTTDQAKLMAEVDRVYAAQQSDTQQIEGIRQEIGELTSQNAALDGEGQTILAAISQIHSLMSMQVQDEAERNELKAQLNQRVEQAMADMAQAQSGEAAQAERIKAQQDKIEEITQGKLELDGERSRLQRESQERNTAILNMEREAARLSGKREQEELQIRSILDKLWEVYELTPTNAEQVAVPIENLAEAGQEATRCRSQIKALGDVNLLAVEEYAKTNERYQFLAAQRADLESAKAEILKIIDQLTQSMQATFAAHFVQLNESFTQTFKDIFGGGNAYLQLEDEGDILNCGIEIKVELPGKTIKTISLLSGGEKAFVAIALYFAILKVRPTPFCVLDEIEAALDDVNVVKYIQYMGTLCHNTQFIVITHRRGTMEGSDVLYGVTMQEHGVSKLLSINVSDVEKELE